MINTIVLVKLNIERGRLSSYRRQPSSTYNDKQRIYSMSNDKLKVLSWVDNGAPAKYGVLLEGNKYLTMKKKRWNYLNYLWFTLMMPTAHYNIKDDAIEFTASFSRES